MAKDDYYVIVCEVLSYLYQCLKSGVDPEEKKLQPEALHGINRKYWYYIFLHLAEDGYIEGIDFAESIGGTPEIVGLQHAEITPAGIGYLLDNNLVAKAKKFLKEMKEINPFV